MDLGLYFTGRKRLSPKVMRSLPGAPESYGLFAATVSLQQVRRVLLPYMEHKLKHLAIGNENMAIASQFFFTEPRGKDATGSLGKGMDSLENSRVQSTELNLGHL